MEKRRMKVLLTGSESRFLETMEQNLKDQYDVLSAANATDAINAARSERPDIILIGSLQPGATAFELYNKLERDWIGRHIPRMLVELPGDGKRLLTEHEAEQTEDYFSLSPSDLASKISERIDTAANPLKKAILDPGTFCITWEQIPGRGAFEVQQAKIFDNVAQAARGGRIHAVSVTDNPSGNPALSTAMLCAAIKRSGMEPLVHLACRDKNRTDIESILYGVAAEGIRNILVLTGDYTSNEGFADNEELGGRPKPVFDVDSVNVLRLVETMNRGLEHTVLRKKVTLAPTDFFAGACVSPFKRLESELMTQYAKLDKKIRAGARYLITQVGYDARKLHELLQWLKVAGHDIPVLANVYVLPYGTARVMNQNMIPGCVVTDKLVSELARERESEDKGREARLLRSAKQFAIAKGMGCSGVHIGGHGISYDMVKSIIDRGNELAGDWQKFVKEFDYPQGGGFYYFEKNPETGLNTDAPAKKRKKRPTPFVYRLSKVAHALMFNEKSIQFKFLQTLAKWLDSSPGATAAAEFNEHIAKVALFGCMNCGDCAIFDIAYICPMSQCPKQQRNGPCGGSYRGWCEVYPDEQKCIWVQAYERLKASGKETADYIVPPCNWDLRLTSSWLNFYLGRDHTAKRLGIKPPVKKRKD